MKPHSLRRGLWLANLVLGAAVLAVAAWFVLKVKPAVAQATQRKPKERPFEKLRKEYEGMRMSGLKWTPKVPVSLEELNKVITRSDFEKKQPRHWIFSGPLPPEDRPDEVVERAGPPPPEGLDVLGSITALIYDPPDGTTILFDFNGDSLAFGLGDFVRKTKDDPGRFKLTGVRTTAPGIFEVTYEVYGKDPDKPERTGKMTYDNSVGESYADFLRPPGGAPTGAKSSGGGSAGASGDGASGEGTTDGETDEAGGKDGEGWVKGSERVVEAPSKPVEELTLGDLRPEVEVNPRNKSQRAIKFDRNTYDYFRSKNAKTVAESVKTKIAKDPATGRVIGLQITGFAKDAPADVFDVRRGDILVSINGRKVTTRSDAVRIVQQLNPNNLVTVVIDRLGRKVTYRVDPSDPKNRRKVRYFENLK